MVLRCMIFRYDTSGNWYKGNSHLHSTASDGGSTFRELAALYRSAGFDFLFRTDHWVASDAGADTEPYPLLWLDGIELDGQDHTGASYHVVCLGRVSGIRREAGLEAGMEAARSQGALILLAHPHWCANSIEDALRWPFDGVEVYNNVCHWLNGKSGGWVHWDAMMMRNPAALGLAVDDAHVHPQHPSWNGGWIVVNAPACTTAAILDGIRRGNFYSSCGPELRSLAFDGEELRAATSPVRFARLVGPGPCGLRAGALEGPLLETVRFEVPREWRYLYLELEDAQGRRAWTNALFTAKG